MWRFRSSDSFLLVIFAPVDYSELLFNTYIIIILYSRHWCIIIIFFCLPFTIHYHANTSVKITITLAKDVFIYIYIFFFCRRRANKTPWPCKSVVYFFRRHSLMGYRSNKRISSLTFYCRIRLFKNPVHGSAPEVIGVSSSSESPLATRVSVTAQVRPVVVLTESDQVLPAV